MERGGGGVGRGTERMQFGLFLGEWQEVRVRRRGSF